MATNELSTYLADHLAGSISSEGLVSRLLELELEPGLTVVLREVGESLCRHQGQVRALLRLRGDDYRGKSAGGWLVERLARPTFASRGDDGFGLLRSLETLILGLHGRVALWQTMEAVIPSHPELHDFDATTLREEATRELEQVDRYRVAVARVALRGWTAGEVVAQPQETMIPDGA